MHHWMGNMRKFYTCVVNHKKTVLSVFAVLFVVCFCARNFISVNYDMNDYLPEESPSSLALDKMNAEYDGGIPNARVMIQDVSIPEALEYRERLKAVDGVSEVVWLDDSEDITKPTEFMEEDTLDTYYKDDTALYSVTIEKDKRIEACDAIREIIGDENAMSGSAVSTAVATTSTVTEIPIIAIFGVIFAFFVLTITTTSWAEPVIVLAGLGVAIVINSGSNLIFGEISFVTNAAGSILQLAVSLDYSVFLLHRFTECREKEPDEKIAMVEALCGSTTSILSSGLTAVIGFLAFCMMRFRIGPDLGLVLAKGIAISLITVFAFMPVFILTTYKYIEKTRHRSFMPSFTRFGRFVYKTMLPCVIIFSFMIVPAYLASNQNSFYYGASHIFGSKTQLGSDVAKIEKVFGKNDTYVLMVPKESRQRQEELSDALHEFPQVKNIVSYVDTVGAAIPESYLDADTLSKLDSKDCTRMVISVRADYEGGRNIRIDRGNQKNGRKILSGAVVSCRRRGFDHRSSRYGDVGYGKDEFNRDRSCFRGASRSDEIDIASDYTGPWNRNRNLGEPCNTIFYGQFNFLHCIFDYQLHPARGNGRLRNPVYGQIQRIPRKHGTKGCRNKSV